MKGKIGLLTAVAGGRFGRCGVGQSIGAAVCARGGRSTGGGLGGRGRLGLVVLVVFVGVMLAGRSVALAADPACSSAAGTTAPCQYYATGAEQTYTVPAGVTVVTVHANGALGAGDPCCFYSQAGAPASVTATVPLPTGTTTLYVEVGTRGSFGAADGGAGFNGGGASRYGGGGGGASDVRTCSRSACPDLSTDDTRLVVAGGGGGAGRNGLGCSGGNGGGIGGATSVTGPGDGGSGGNVCDDARAGGAGGLGGTGPGAPGANATGSTCPGQAGAPPAAPAYSCQGQGGGGGGGYYGGGGGGDGLVGGGGGAGSSFWVSGATSTLMYDPCAYPGPSYGSIASVNPVDDCTTPEVVINPVRPSSTDLTSSPNPSAAGGLVTYTAEIRPNPRGGTVAFYQGGSQIAACADQHVDPSTGKATCQVVYHRVKTHTIRAVFSGYLGFGMPYEFGGREFAGSTSAPLTQRVVARPSASISSPANNKTFRRGKYVATRFSCSEAPGGPGLSSCKDSNGASAPTGTLKTSKRGKFHYTVTATSKDGGIGRATIIYTIK